MQIYKSFFKNYNTKIYIFFLSLIIFLLVFLISYYNYYKSIIDDAYSDSYVSLLINKNEIDDIKKNTDYKVENENIILFGNFYCFDYVQLNINNNFSLNDNEIILPSVLRQYFNINDQVVLNLDNQDFTFKIINFSDDLQIFNAYISQSEYHKIDELTEFRKINLQLTNWLYKDKIISNIQDKYVINNNYGINVTTTQKANENYLKTISIINIFIYLMSLCILIIYFIILLSVYNDNSKFNLLLHLFGYKETTIEYYNFVKILLLIIISSIISFILLLIANLFLSFLHINFEYIIIISLILIFINFIFINYYLMIGKEKY